MPRTVGRIAIPLAALSLACALAAVALLNLGSLPEPGGGGFGVQPPIVAEPYALTPDALGGPEPFPHQIPAAPPDEQAPPLVLRGAGWGHSVGMSQYGAQAQAEAGRDYREILTHYYQGVEVAQDPRADAEIRVNLFRNRDGVDRTRLELSTSSRDGARPDRAVLVELGDGEPAAVPFASVWTLTIDSVTRELVLLDAGGTEQARGSGPARIRYDFLDGRPTLLRLPQFTGARPRHRLTGTYQWGYLEVDIRGRELRPVMVLSMETYLRGLAEMPSGWHVEALKAQAVAGRTYALREILDGIDSGCACHLGTTPHDQVYAGFVKEGAYRGDRWAEAVAVTAGQVVTYDGDLAWTYYSSSHGGRTESVDDSWAFGGEPLPYLVSVDDPWSLEADLRNPFAHWERQLSNAQFATAIGGGLVEVRGVRVTDRTAGGTPARLEVRGVDTAGNERVLPFVGWRTGIAGADLKLALRSGLPSQQLTSIGLAPFADDDGHPFEYEIAVVTRHGVMAPCDAAAQRFCPDLAVTRGDAAVFLARVQGVEPAPIDRPDDPLLRADAAVLLTRARALAPTALDGFVDVVDPTHRHASNAVAEAGIMPGCAVDRFCPDLGLTRAEVAVLLVRGFGLAW